MEKITYTSPVFKNSLAEARRFLIPLNALETYAKRDAALLKMIALGGIHAKPTSEFMKIRSKMLSAKRKIERQGWFSELVAG